MCVGTGVGFNLFSRLKRSGTGGFGALKFVIRKNTKMRYRTLTM